MKKTLVNWTIILLAIALIFAFLSTTFEKEDANTYKMNGTAIEKHYHEDGDYTTMFFETEDGNIWEVETICPLQTEVEITFNTNGTDAKEDDEIVSIKGELI